MKNNDANKMTSACTKSAKHWIDGSSVWTKGPAVISNPLPKIDGLRARYVESRLKQFSLR